MAGDIAGPYCAKLLADLGAEVTKIERPSGDPMREWGPFPGGVPDPNRSGLFEYLNAGKYGTTVDLEADASAASRLIADAHVLVEALGPGMLDRLGLGVRVLEALRPGLVVVRISDFGHRGPLRDRRGHPADRAGGVGLDQQPRSRPAAGAGRREDLRVRRGRLRRAECAHGAEERCPPTQLGSSRWTCRCWSRCCRRFLTRC